MKLHRNEIRLSPSHPSLLLNLQPESFAFAPLVVEGQGMLIDGYRRFQLSHDDELECSVFDTTNVFEAAREMNRNTRTWDQTDCLLWSRWLESFPDRISAFTPEPMEPLRKAPILLWQALAERKIVPRQAVLLMEAPARHRALLTDLITGPVHLNANETAYFIEMACDLTHILKQNDLSGLFQAAGLSRILTSPMDRRQRGEALLKAMRVLRYPEYQKNLQLFTELWQELDLENVLRIHKARFLERGVMEIVLSCRSAAELREKSSRLQESLLSAVWDKIFQEL